jgi:molecular chaperone GrpE
MTDHNRGNEGEASRYSSSAGAQEPAEGDAPISNEVAELRTQLDEAKERALRVQAEWENFRKRARRDIEEERRYADLRLLGDLLPVLDNVQRAIEAATKSADGGGLLEGIKLVKQQMENVLAQHQCQRIEALNHPFDPHMHEAVLQQPSSEVAPNTVMQVVREGFMLHDRVIRPAQVIVAAAPAPNN